MSMKRTLLLLLVPPMVLSSCQNSVAFPPLSADISLQGLSAEAHWATPWQGFWEVTSAPSWVTVTPKQGAGNIDIQIKPKPSTALCSKQTGTIEIQWRSVLTGTTQLNVTYDSNPGLRTESTAPDLGVIVKYRNTGAAKNAMLSSQFVAGSLDSKRVLLQGVALDDLAQDPNVEYAIPNSPVQAFADPVVPTDQFYPLQWAFKSLDYPKVWGNFKVQPPQKEVVVAVLDTGIRYDHPDLEGRLLGAAEGALDVVGLTPALNDGFGLDQDPTDPTFKSEEVDPCSGRSAVSHGTHVSGILVANSGTFAAPCPECSSSGVVGATLFAPIKVLPIRVLNMYPGRPGGPPSGSDFYSVASAIRYAAGESLTFKGKTYTNSVASKVKVINLSLGGNTTALAARDLCDAVSFAKSKGILVVAASGNAPIGSKNVSYPAACPDALAVGSVSLGNTQFQRAYYSNYGEELSLMAPGGNSKNHFNGAEYKGEAFPDVIWSTDWNFTLNLPRYSGMEGTSQAAPQVSALAALLYAKGLVTSPDEAKAKMENSALDLGAPGFDNEYGYGLIQPLKALDIAP